MSELDIVIECHNATKIYNNNNQVQNIDFTVQKGTCLALCGSNGAGKSTIIKMLIGIITPTSGEIYLNKHKVSAKNTFYKSMFSYMPDSMVFPKTLTGYEVLTFFAKLDKLPLKQVTELIRVVGLENDQHKKVKEYSKGMQQRLALAQALLSESPILVLDEPTNGLDPYWVRRFKQIIKHEQEKGKTIIFSSHVLSVVEDLADTVVFINQGQMLINDSIHNLCSVDGEYRSLEEVFFHSVHSSV
ncbi:ABC transporter ATP-binding protein [Cytobacillus sp. IB215665]|uniref:ABC transporter ATP-binding protein n=1 Tax=Cytobacillus sp. IB215665 TaxID=3097357 RepID=UPI002A1247A4|nr:ABC transporter ATP-binding protein [Cytobacillus sp. IB215665]MDX8367417.1 ABC transporter ATP-binding protein [Cytobacillus sp. IB215665]